MKTLHIIILIILILVFATNLFVFINLQLDDWFITSMYWIPHLLFLPVSTLSLLVLFIISAIKKQFSFALLALSFVGETFYIYTFVHWLAATAAV